VRPSNKDNSNPIRDMSKKRPELDSLSLCHK
jgi:hypothetical protein